MLAILLVGLTVVFSFIARKPLCIDSKLVDKVDIVSDSKTVSAYRCGVYRRVEFDPQLAEITKSLGPRMLKMERAFEMLNPLKSKITLRFYNTKDPQFFISGSRISMGLNQLASRGQLEKAVLKIWFRENASSELRGQLLMEEVLTDFLLYAINGDLSLQDPEGGVAFSTELDNRWPQVLSSFQSYCKGIWKSAEHLDLCTDLSIHIESDEIYLMSVRPLLTQAMIEAFDTLGSAEKIDFLRAFAGTITKMNYLDRAFGMTVMSHGRQTYYEAVYEVENLKYLWSQVSKDSINGKKFAHYFENDLKKMGFSEADGESSFDVLMISQQPSEKLKGILPKLLNRKSKFFTGFESQGYLTIDFKKEPLSLDVVGKAKAFRGILVQCGTPSLEELKKYTARFQKMIYVNDCNKQDMKLDALVDGDVGKFAFQNPTVKFAEFHMPSLLLALNKTPGINFVEMLAAKNWKSLRPLGFGEPMYDDMIKAYRANSAIGLVDLFRL